MALDIQGLEAGEFETFLNHKSQDKVIIFSLDKCKPCEQLKHNFEKVTNYDNINFFLMSLSDQNTSHLELMEELNIRFYPTVFYFKNNECIGKIRGVANMNLNQSQQMLVAWLDKYSKNN